MKMRSSKQFAAMLTVAIIMMSVVCVAQSSKKHPHYPVPTHHSEFRFDSKKLPCSTPNGSSLAGKANPYAQEVLHLEKATSSDLHVSARNETRAWAGTRASVRGHEHSTPINFSFHSSSNSGSGVSSRRR